MRADSKAKINREENVCKTLYGSATAVSTAQPGSNSFKTLSSNLNVIEKDHNKVNTICNAFLQIFKGLDGYYLQNEITAHTCKVPPDLEAALKTVSAYKGMRKVDIRARNANSRKETKKVSEKKQ